MTMQRNPDPASSEPSDGEQEHPIRPDDLRVALATWELFGRALPHELRAPLAAIDAFATLLQEREAQVLSPRGRLWLDRIRAASLHASGLADGLLELAPLSLRAMERVPVDLSALAAQVIDLERTAAPGRQAQVMIESGLAGVGDPGLLRILLANLLGNAWKYTSTRPQSRIAFGITHGLAGGPAFCVSDNGVGFNMKHAPKLFRPFERLHTRSEFEGVGLGLCIAQRVVQRHGGSIWIDSEPDTGTRVLFRLSGSGAAV